MSEMAEYINDNQKAVAPGEPIVFDNPCESPFEVSAGLVFRKDGDYIVSVRGGKITVRVNGEPAVRRGRWEYDSDGVPNCSQCGEFALQRLHLYIKNKTFDAPFKLTDYCPNCGAKMDGEEYDGV